MDSRCVRARAGDHRLPLRRHDAPTMQCCERFNFAHTRTPTNTPCATGIALDAPWFRKRSVIDAYLALLGVEVAWVNQHLLPQVLTSSVPDCQAALPASSAATHALLRSSLALQEYHVMVSNHTSAGDLMCLFALPRRCVAFLPAETQSLQGGNSVWCVGRQQRLHPLQFFRLKLYVCRPCCSRDAPLHTRPHVCMHALRYTHLISTALPARVMATRNLPVELQAASLDAYDTIAREAALEPATAQPVHL